MSPAVRRVCWNCRKRRQLYPGIVVNNGCGMGDTRCLPCWESFGQANKLPPSEVRRQLGIDPESR